MAKKGITAINIDLEPQAHDILNHIGKETAEKIKAASPKKTGKYASGWVHKFVGKNTVVVYNITKPKIVHLLEKGHVVKKKKGGPTYGVAAPRPHVLPTGEAMGKKYFKELQKISLTKASKER